MIERRKIDDSPLYPNEQESLDRLIEHAKRGAGQSSRVANFLLAWWNADDCGGFDLMDLCGVDTDIAEDMLVVLRLIARLSKYPDSLGLKKDFEEILKLWRPDLAG
jgi:hypothetical protein